MSNIEAAGFIIAIKTDEKSKSPDIKLLPEFENRNYKFLLIKSSKHNEWGFPKGHTSGSEKILQAAFRELEEETGLTQNDLTLLSDTAALIEYEVDLPAEKGLKKVYYFLAESMKPEIKLSEEHKEWIWESPLGAYELLEFENLKLLIKYFCQNYPAL